MNIKTALYLLVFAGFFFRLLGLANITLGGDFKYNWSVAGKIVSSVDYPVIGPVASISEGFRLGPFFYYFLAVHYYIAGGNYKIAIILFSIINSLAIFIFYKLVKEWFDEKLSLKITVFFTFSSYMISIGNFPLNACLIPLAVILILHELTKINKGELIYLPALALTFSLAIQLHATVILLVPLILLSIPYAKLKPRYVILAVILFLIPSLPWLYVEESSGLSQTKALLSTIFNNREEECVFGEWLVNHGHGERCFHYLRNTLFVFRLFSMSLFGNTSLFLVFLSAVIVIFTFLTSKLAQKKIFIFWLGGVFLLYLFYPANIYLHYMHILIPLPFIIFAIFLQELEKAKWGKYLSISIFIIFIINNILHYIFSLNVPRS